MLGIILRAIRSKRKLSLMDIKNKTGLSKSSLSNIENGINNPTIDNLEKICSALDVDITKVLKLTKNFEVANEEEFSTLEQSIDKFIDEILINNEFTTIFKNTMINNDYKFENPQEAIKFILEQPAIMGYGGFDINKLSDKDILEFANDLLIQLKNLGYKYKR